MTLKQPKATGVDTYSSMDQLMDLMNKIYKHLAAPSDTLPEVIGHGRAPVSPYTPGMMAARMYGSGVDSNTADKSDRLDLPSDPNQTAHPRIQMDAALASPAKSAKPKTLPPKPKSNPKQKERPKPTAAEKMSDFITTISR